MSLFNRELDNPHEPIDIGAPMRDPHTIRTWEIKFSNRCVGQMQRIPTEWWKQMLGLHKKEKAPGDPVKEQIELLEEFIVSFGLQNNCSGIIDHFDCSGRRHILIRTSEFVAKILTKCTSVAGLREQRDPTVLR